jgi:AcrR family transcriptional regulator
VYYYYPTKDELFFAVLEATYQKMMADLERVLTPETPVKERLTRLFERLAAVSDEEVEILRLVALEGLMATPRFERLVERFMRGHIALGLKTILDGLADGTLDRRRHPIVLLLATFGLAGPPQLMRRVIGDRLPLPGAPGGQVLARELVEVLLHGIAPKTP